MIGKFLVLLIKGYQKIFSPDHGIFNGGFYGCRFFPSCSEYTRQAIEKKGPAKGLALGIKRIIRCNPWNEGGYDPLN
ncbi:MAG: hypothetical protein UT31_C0007G0018 [Parcubacteria group bacterium GW2011_GWF2_39_13b]|nr:MAG: hypothetical protein UT31_C0007G0018 [Parcubacteria group bacterium GW2011_GWF2_39_13b]